MSGLYDWRDEPGGELCLAAAGRDGRDFHLCSRVDGHDNGHRCDCGHTWPRVPHPSSGPP